MKIFKLNISYYTNMKVKLDLKDKKLLYILLQNSYIPTKRLASLVGLSKNSIKYRIQRLKELGVIERFHPVVADRALNRRTYDLFLKYRATEKEEKKFKDYIKNHPNVIWATTLFGKWDMFIQILADGDYTKITEDILLRFGKNLEQYELKEQVQLLKISHQVFDIKGFKYSFKSPIPKETVKIDKLDKKILSYLSTVDALASYTEVARAVKASPETTRNRIKRFFKTNLIRYSFPFLNYDKLGINSYIVNMDLRNLTPAKEKEIEDYMKYNKNINIAFRSKGRLQVYFWVITKNIEELEKILREIRNKFYNEIIDIDYNFVTEEITLNFFPKGLLK